MVGVGYPTPMDRDTGLIRTDEIGRLRFTADQRRVLVDAFESSGQSASGFAAQHGIKYTTFANWVQKRRAVSVARSAMRSLLHRQFRSGHTDRF